MTSPRPPHEPAAVFPAAQRLLDDAAKFTPALGCRGCADYGTCGGLHIDAGVFDCGGLCTCADPAVCDMVSPRRRRRPSSFASRREYSGEPQALQKARRLPG